MPKKRLTTVYCNNAGPGYHFDSNRIGLYLRVRGNSKIWLQRITIHGKRKDISLGSFRFVSLAEARQKAFENLKLARTGGDPRRQKRESGIPTFAEAAEKVIELRSPSWKDGARSAEIWRSSLQRYVFPVFGNKPVHLLTSSDVMDAILPHWETRTETMRRVRQRCNDIFKWAIAQNFRPDNPAGDSVLSALPKDNGRKNHFKALPHGEVQGAIETVRNSGAFWSTKLAFEFLVLTAARSGEVRLATWNEIDMEKEIWTIPAERMKMKKEHKVPLSQAAIAVLKQAEKKKGFSDINNGLIFPSKKRKVMSDVTLSKLIKELGIEAVPHGFRSSFRNFAGEQNFSREIAEATLAHTVRGVEGSYFRSDLFELRRELMESWGNYLELA